MHKRTGQIVAIKQVLVKEDADEIMKEIAYMKGCQSDYIVRFYGHYLKGDTLWVNIFSLSLSALSFDVNPLSFFARL